MVFVVKLKREPFPKGGGEGVGFLSKFLEMGDAVALLLMRWTMDQKVWVQRPWGGSACFVFEWDSILSQRPLRSVW